MIRVVILGTTGSIGVQALDVIERHSDRFEVVAMAAGTNVELLVEQARRFRVPFVGIANESARPHVLAALEGVDVVAGPSAAELVAQCDADIVLNGITGAAGLPPTLAALANGTRVALANKESLIVGGPLVVAAADRLGARQDVLLPVDSEHSAVAQCLRAGAKREVAKLTLTASGGPFRGYDSAALEQVTRDQALEHPTWQMGPVITVNSATLMNKGFELIEAHELFDLEWDLLDAIVHPQSIVHSMVEFIDGSTIAQLSPPDMRLPIQLALSWPQRLDQAFVTCDWSKISTLTFEPVDRATFPALDIAEAAGRAGGTHPAVLNAANERAVDAFLAGQIRFVDIVAAVAATLGAWNGPPPRDIDDVWDADRWARGHADRLIETRAR
ncbi:MAG: 1-deoxy-D-xylulose-5-phosphate reductoisomerase [Nitriliruptoraceae bacterium]